MSELTKKKVIMVLDEYPYGIGEYSFIKTELDCLVKYYDVVLISVALSTEQRMEVDSRITVYHCERKFSILQIIFAIIGYILSKCGRYEIRQIIGKRGRCSDTLGWLYDSMKYYRRADLLRRYVKRNNIIDSKDTIIYSYWFNANCLAFLMDKKVNELPKVVSRIHGYDLYKSRNPYNRQPFREYMDRLVDKIFFVADKGLDYYISNWGDVDKIGSKYLVFPIGTVSGKKIKYHKKIDIFNIVSCSSVIELKRVDLIVEALSQINDIKINWIHFGDGALLDEIQNKANNLLGRKDNISYCFKGYIPIGSIMEYYEENYIDCFITTSSSEGCPVSVQEAMSFGIPIIGTAVGEIPNMINGNGILLSENPEIMEVCDAIRDLYFSTEEQVDSMRSKSRKMWENKYNAVLNAENFAEELMKL